MKQFGQFVQKISEKKINKISKILDKYFVSGKK